MSAINCRRRLYHYGFMANTRPQAWLSLDIWRPQSEKSNGPAMTCLGNLFKSTSEFAFLIGDGNARLHRSAWRSRAPRNAVQSRFRLHTIQGAAGWFRVLQTPPSRTWQSPAANLRPSIWKSRYLSAHSRRFYSGLIVLFCPEWMQGLQRPATGFCSATSPSAKHIWRS